MSEHLIRIEIEAETVERAQELVKGQLRGGQFLVGETILTHGGRQAAGASAENSETAFAQARSRIPEGAQILGEQELVAPTRRTVTIAASDEAAAAALVKTQLGPTETIARLQCVVPGRKGWLGLGRRPAQFQADVVQPAIVEVSYRRRARIVARIGRETRAADVKSRLDAAERADHPVGLLCDQCGRGCKALPRPMSGRTPPVLTPELAIVASRYCERCNQVFCGSCVGVTLQSAAPDFGGRRCPRCGSETEYAAVCHLRVTDTILSE